LTLLGKNCKEITVRQEKLEILIPEKAGQLQSLGIKLKGMEGNPHLAKQYAALKKQKDSLVGEVRSLRLERFENEALLQGLTGRLERMKQGIQDDPRAHIHHLAVPVKTARMRFDHAMQTWAAISQSVLLFGIVVLMVLTPKYLIAGLLILTILIVAVESILRGAFVQTVGSITIFLAMVSAMILLIHFWYWILIGVLLLTAFFLMAQRLREVE
jgi:hypothetical protein